MPIRIPNDLPAASALRSENIFVMTDTRAKTQDIRPLKILLLNLMPTKIATETQLARLLGNTPIQVELELLMVKSHVAKNTSEEHMLAFYKTFDQVCGKTYDGFGPIGPYAVDAESLPAGGLGISCRVNGELRQNSNTKYLLHSISEIIAELSQGMTLLAGTIIATGTPAGVGMGFDPPKFLKSGDVVTCEIEKIGRLTNMVK